MERKGDRLHDEPSGIRVDAILETDFGKEDARKLTKTTAGLGKRPYPRLVRTILTDE